jgi:hypothetical protein
VAAAVAAAAAAVANPARAAPHLAEHALHFAVDLKLPRRLRRRRCLVVEASLVSPREEVRAVRRQEARRERPRGVSRSKRLRGQHRAEELARDEGGGAVAAVAVEDAEGADRLFSRDGRVRFELWKKGVFLKGGEKGRRRGVSALHLPKKREQLETKREKRTAAT